MLSPVSCLSKNPAFTPMGSQLDLALFLGFLVVYQLVHLITTQQPNKQEIKQSVLNYSIFTINLLALFLSSMPLSNQVRA